MSSPTTLATTVIATLFGFSLSWTSQEIVEDTVQPRRLQLETLRFNDDQTVTQRLTGNIPAEWTARTTRTEDGVKRVLCAGQGDAPGVYRGLVQTFTVSDWVGDTCPDLVKGDQGVATWTYRNEEGLLITIIGEFEVN